ncbi:MAG: ankyrin repeat domain-containing protein, partial [Planctomycetes bacterium]|nr:ankyrin repeat domain-containing protein [Planctomycetota bacterium]
MMRESLLQDLSLWGCLWQSMAFIALGLVAGYLLRRRPSRAYQVLLFAMLAAVIVPLMSAVVKHYDLGVFTARATDSFGTLLEGPEAIPLAGTDDLAGIAVPAAVSPADINSGPAEITSTRFSISWRTVAVYGWIIATLALLARLIVTFMYGAYIVRNAQRPGREQVQRAVDDVTLNLGLSCGLQVRGSRRIRSPIVWCWSRPPILLVPNSCRDPRIDWAGVVAHELAHSKRRDHITGLMAELMVCLLPWNPLMWLSKKCLVRLGEQACDDWVVATGQPSEDYAESLLRFRPQRQMAFLPAVVHSKKGLAGRIDRILKDSCGNPRVGVGWVLAMTIVAIWLTMGVAFAQTRSSGLRIATEHRDKPITIGLTTTAETGTVDTHLQEVTEALQAAVKEGDIRRVEQLISEGGNVNAKYADGWTPLHWALSCQDEQLAELLIVNGADGNVGDNSGLTGLHWAVMMNQTKLGKLLITRGTDVGKSDNDGWTPLHHAANDGLTDMATLLLEQGADVAAVNKHGETPLDVAAMGDGAAVAELLVARGVEVTTLHAAALLGDLKKVNRFISEGTDIDSRNSSNGTPLHAAASGGHLDVVRLLLANGADINATTKDNTTPLNSAALAGHDKIAKMLIEAG